MRNKYDLSAYSFSSLGMGAMQTLGVWPILPNDSIDMIMYLQVKLAPLRRALSMDAEACIMGAFIPHRHVYDDDWISFIEEGVDGTTTLTDKDIGAGTGQIYYYLGGRFTEGNAYPRWRLEGYNRFWDRYCRHKTLTPDLDHTWVPVDSARPTNHTSSNSPIVSSVWLQNHGFQMSRPATPWSRGIVSGLTTADYELSSATEFSIIALDQLKGRFKSEQERDWFYKQYPEIMSGQFGTGVSIDTDQRPELLFKHKFSIQGYDVDGHDDSTLGVSSGKAIGNGGFAMPRKYFSEHGSLWVFIVLRFPTILLNEMHPLENTGMAEPTYKQIAGDNEIISVEPPASDDLDSWTTETGNVDIGTLPYCQWYRWQPSKVHPFYDDLLGYPFLAGSTITNHQEAVYTQPNEYDDVFQSDRLGNAQCQAVFKVNALRSLAGPRSSIYAGAR